MKESMKVNKYYNLKNVSYKLIRKLGKQANLSQADLAYKVQFMEFELTAKKNFKDWKQ